MRHLVLLAALAAACGNTVTTISSGQFAAPVGLAATSAGDRDLLFVANSGKDGLIALQLCNHALDDAGNIQAGDTCDTNENLQFIPGPIRVFPGTIETAPRTIRVAGARLTLPDGGVPDGGANGEALTVGADNTLQVVDARALVDAEHGGAPPFIVVGGGDGGVGLGGQGVDVVAVNALDPATDLEVATPSVRVFAVTVQPAQLVAMTATLDASGLAQNPTVDAACSLDPVIPRRIAAVPGDPSAVYIADGAGDGVVRVDTAGIAGGACPMTRISAGGRTTRSVAVSPPWYASVDQTKHPAGEILAMVVDPPVVSTPQRPQDPGGVLFARASDGSLFPVPPFSWDSVSATDSNGQATTCTASVPDGGTEDRACEPMQPLQPTGIPREVAFLRSLNADTSCTLLPCTPLNYGVTAGLFDLIAAVSSTDGSTSFIDVLNRRFPDSTLVALPANGTLLTPAAAGISPSTQGSLNGTLVPNWVTLSPGDDPNGPLLKVDTTTVNAAGITHTAIWRAIYHSPIIGLDRRAGTLSQNADGTMTFVAPPADLAVWMSDPAVQLGPGDVIALGFWISADPNCQELVATQNANSGTEVSSYELPILSISGDTVIVGSVPGTVDLTGACGSVSAVAEFRIAGSKPWLVYNAATVVGRVAAGQTFVAKETRWDYPFASCDDPDYQESQLVGLPDGGVDTVPIPPVCNGSSCTTAPNGANQTCGTGCVPCYDKDHPPVLGNEQSFTFTIDDLGAAIQPTSGFTWQMSNGQAPLSYSDLNVANGYATAILGYSSPRNQSFVFTSITGANEILQADPAVLRSDISGIQGYQ